MPTSPELRARAWEPQELTAFSAPPQQPHGAPEWVPMAADDSVAVGSAFAVSTSVGVPEQLLADAREQARQEGYDAGWLEGQQQGLDLDRAAREQHAAELVHRRQLAAQELARAVAALDLAAQRVAESTADALARFEELAVHAAIEIAEAIVGHSVRNDPQRGLTAVRRALTLVPTESAEVHVAVHPQDLAVLGDVAPGLLPAAVSLVADATLEPGDAVATAGATTVDARVHSALARVREALS